MAEPNPAYLEGVICHKPAPDGKLITVIPLTFARGRINRGEGSGASYSDGW
jgi:hypothetical protein